MKGYVQYADLIECSNIPEGDELRRLAIEAVNDAHMQEVRSLYGHFPKHIHKSNSGDSVMTLIIPLEESHLAIHTWPEQKLVCIDLFTCGDTEKAKNAVNNLITIFQPKYRRVSSINRGNA